MKTPLDKACAAHTDLNTFGAIISILEGGCLYTPRSHRAADKIITMCKREQQRCLFELDQAAKDISK